jgi:hypothetical protein
LKIDSSISSARGPGFSGVFLFLMTSNLYSRLFGTQINANVDHSVQTKIPLKPIYLTAFGDAQSRKRGVGFELLWEWREIYG